MSSHVIRAQRDHLLHLTAAGQGIVRVAGLLGVPPLLRERGVELVDVLASAGLAPNALDDADNRIPYTALARLLQRCVESTKCAHFGLLVGQYANLSTLGIMGELMRRSPSVRAALRSLILHLHLHTRGAVPTHRIEGGNATFGYAIYQRGVPVAAQVYDQVLAYEFNVMRDLCGSRWIPSEVLFSHATPVDVRPYRQFFPAALHFDAGRSEIVFRKTWLDHVPPDSDAKLHRDIERKIATQEMLSPDDHAERIRRALPAMVLSGSVSETHLSNLLSIPLRTLHRLLAGQGTSFRELLEEVRFEIARQLLTDTHMTTAQVAATLVYSDASAFTRAFRRWTNSPPATWRANKTTAGGRRGMSSRGKRPLL